MNAIARPTHTHKIATSKMADKVKMSVLRPKTPPNEYNLFLILEKHRVLKLKNLYHNKVANLPPNEVNRESDAHGYEGIATPPLPPRYRNLELPKDWFVTGFRKQILEVKTHKKWKSLDRVTKGFFKDVADTLRHKYNENIMSHCLTPFKNVNESIEPVPVTPPSSPKILAATSSPPFLSPSPQEPQEPKHPAFQINLVEISDEEIRSIWENVEPED